LVQKAANIGKFLQVARPFDCNFYLLLFVSATDFSEAIKYSMTTLQMAKTAVLIIVYC